MTWGRFLGGTDSMLPREERLVTACLRGNASVSLALAYGTKPEVTGLSKAGTRVAPATQRHPEALERQCLYTKEG